MTKTNFPEALFDAGVTDLVSVIPPTAQLAPSSKIPPAHVGKVPGRITGNGTWAGYAWRTHEPTIDDVRGWCSARANVGVRADRFPAVDIDCTDETLAAMIEEAALKMLGPAPVRVGRAPKRLLMYRATEPFGRMRLWLKRGDETHLVEVLGQGQQYLVYGTHPTTMRAYEWLSDPVALGADGLAPLSREAASDFLDQLSYFLEMLPGIRCEREGDGRPITRTAATDQSALVAPSLDALRAAVALIPNDNDGFPDRTSYLRMAYAIRAAAGEHLEDGFDVFGEWAARWGGNGRVAGNDPDTVRADWRRIRPPYAVGWSWIAEQARAYGFNDAALEFEADPCATAAPPPEHIARFEKFNADYAIVRRVPHAVLYTPDVGDVDFIPMAHWRQVTANKKIAVPQGNGQTRLMPLNKYWIEHERRRDFENIVFDPAKPALASVPASHVGEDFNMWPGLLIQPSPDGSCNLILAYIRDVVCSGDSAANDWVIQWLADVFQHPASLPGTALVLRGGMGVGKTTLGKFIREIVGPRLHTFVSSPAELTARFNSQLQGRLMIQVEEGYFAGDPSAVGKLKHLVTSPTIRIEKKGMEPYDIAHFGRLLFTSNEGWVVPAGSRERRFTVLDVSDVHAQDAAYFGPLHAEAANGGLARFLYFLLYEVTIDKRINSPLVTNALRDQQMQSLPAEQRWLCELLSRGDLPGDSEGIGRAPTDAVFADYERFARGSRHGHPQTLSQIGQMLAALGVSKVQSRAGATPGKKRAWYEFPALSECRAVFAKRLAAAPEWDDVAEWQPDHDLVDLYVSTCDGQPARP